MRIRERLETMLWPVRRPVRPEIVSQLPPTIDLHAIGCNCRSAGLTWLAARRVLELVVGSGIEERLVDAFEAGYEGPPESKSPIDARSTGPAVDEEWCETVSIWSRAEGWRPRIAEDRLELSVTGGFSAVFSTEEEVAMHVAERARDGSGPHMEVVAAVRRHAPSTYASMTTADRRRLLARFRDVRPEDSEPLPTAITGPRRS